MSFYAPADKIQEEELAQRVKQQKQQMHNVESIAKAVDPPLASPEQEMFNEQIVRIRELDTQIAEAEADLNKRVEDLYGLTTAEREYYRKAFAKHYP